MKIFLLLAFMLSSYSYAQSGHDHPGDTKKTDHHSEMHDGDHHGGMGGMGGMPGMGGDRLAPLVASTLTRPVGSIEMAPPTVSKYTGMLPPITSCRAGVEPL